MYIVLDTETNDLGYDARIVSICWNLYNKRGKLLEEHYYLIKPSKGMIMNPKAEEVHGISIEQLKKEGVSMIIALDKLKFCITNNKVKGIVGHNLRFDEGIINYETMLYNKECMFDNLLKFCTMLVAVNMLKLKKWPKLNALHGMLFEEGLNEEKLHNAKYDVEVCAKCFFKLKKIKRERKKGKNI